MSYFPMFWAIVPLQLQIAVMKSLRFTLVDYLSWDDSCDTVPGIHYSLKERSHLNLLSFLEEALCVEAYVIYNYVPVCVYQSFSAEKWIKTFVPTLFFGRSLQAVLQLIGEMIQNLWAKMQLVITCSIWSSFVIPLLDYWTKCHLCHWNHCCQCHCNILPLYQQYNEDQGFSHIWSTEVNVKIHKEFWANLFIDARRDIK